MTPRELTVWAPRAGSVDLLIHGERVEMEAVAQGWWRAQVEAEEGTAYRFSLDGGEPRPDPRAMRMPEGPHGPSAVFDPERFAWTDDGWRGVELEGCVIYEMHVGTFTAEGTLDAAAKRLEHLVELGVDMVQLLPLAGFPGQHGWGYDGVNLYAVHEPYGGPEAFQRFVDTAHGLGLAVCLDVVYNHLGPDGNYLGEFGPYFTERYETPWGMGLNLDGRQSDPVRDFVVGNARQWVVDFHVDALRLDAVHELYDDRALPILERLSLEVDTIAAQLDRRIWLIAETDRNDPRTVTPRAAAEGPGTGLGIHAQWADDVHHGLHATLTGETQGYYADFAAVGALAKVLRTPFFHDGIWSSFRERLHGRPVDPELTPGFRFVASLQTHDQVGNRMAGDRLCHLVSPGLAACGAALLLTSAYTPMLFMGEEWGASTPWQYFTDHTDPDLAESVSEGRRTEFASHGWDRADVPDPGDPATVERSRLAWSELRERRHSRMLAWYRALLALRRARADLRDPALDQVRVEHDTDTGLVVVHRGEHLVLVNLGESALEVPVELPLLAASPVLLLAWEPLCRLEDGVLKLPAASAAVVGPSTVG
ncbi:MAG TPA: malto-oligosyltrehalose trehalohydrolase [Dermatophilaceae bacterium]|nr:malto-oligosyltrehalose trehalohydrolase [Dermatophilaceae bacterium]